MLKPVLQTVAGPDPGERVDPSRDREARDRLEEEEAERDDGQGGEEGRSEEDDSSRE